MPRHGKRYGEAKRLVKQGEQTPLEDALQLVKKTATAKFDESVDIAVRLGVNPRQADQMIRGALSLPHGIGKDIKVIVFAEGEAARAAEEAGADVVGGQELIDRVNDGWTDFDKAISVRSLMAKVGRLGRVLGPRGLMPNPRTGTVVGPEDVGRVVREVKAGRVDFRVERAGIIHAPVGKASMTEEALRENVLAFIGHLIKLKPSSAKGQYLRSVGISSTMGPGIRLDPNEVSKLTPEVR